MNLINKIRYYLLPILLSVLPIIAVFFTIKVISIVIIINLIVFFFEKGIKQNFKKNLVYIKPYLIFCLFCILATLLSKNLAVSVKSLERYTSLLLLPIIIFSSDLDNKRIKIILKSFIFIMVGVSLFSIGKLIWFVNVYGDWIEVMRGLNKNDTYVQFKYPHLMWDVHPSYWSYLMIIVNVILLNNKSFNKVFSKKTALILLVLFNLNLFYLSARIPLAINILIHVISVTYFFKEKLKIIVLLYLLIISSMILAYFQLPFLKYKIQSIPNDDRFFLWSLTYDKIESNDYVYGEGFGLGRLYIESELNNIKDPRIDFKGTEIHNQYLSVLLETGILGLFFLIYIYFKPCFSINSKFKIDSSMPLISITFLILIASIIEPFFTVIKGIVIFALFSSLFKISYLNNKKQFNV